LYQGAELATIENSPNAYASMPELSPDGTTLVNVEQVSTGDINVYQGTLVIRTFDDATNTFGPIQTLLAFDSADPNTYNYYPSFSPDGKWIAFTRSNNGGTSYNNGSAETWVIATDGSAAPIRLSAADQVHNTACCAQPTNSWARWVPFGQTFGATGEPMFYLTFSSERPFGTRIPNGGVPQIWMTPFFPKRAEAGLDPSGPAFRVPFQDVRTANHIAQWTTAVVSQD
jgi:hypothetical protein